ncbi:uncharacterized protein TNCV_3130861 [Trichonephila clavipes]|nr:uncharacterized protein TNCV_3130861 [Trichonephila clavipes]
MFSRHHIDDFMRGRIIGKIEEGRKITDVAREFDIAHSVVSRLWKSFKTTGMCRDGTEEVVLEVRRLQKTDISSYQQKEQAHHSSAGGKLVSCCLRKADLPKTVARRLRGKGLYARRPVVCVPLTRQHRTARLQWCREHHNWTEQDWACVLFSDESRFSLASDCRRQLIWRESGTAYRPENIQEKDRYPTCSIMVWAGIMINGHTRPHVVANGTMTGQRYIDEVLLPHVRLFRGAVDLNPIENVWDALGRQVAGRNYPPTNKNTLIRALTEEWDKLPQQLLDNVVQSKLNVAYIIRSNTSVNTESERVDVTPSEKKIEKSEGSFKDYEDNFSVETESRYVIIDLNMLNDIFNNIAKCRCDKSLCFDVAENKSSRKGLATSVSATYKYCGSGHTSMTSNTVSDGYEVNFWFVYGMWCIGLGKSAAQIFCALMNLPPPPAKFERLYSPIFKALETVSSRSMVNSVNEVVIENEHNKNISIALDGTWQKRGHSLKSGVVTATSLDNLKVIDFECLLKYCFECKRTNKNCDNCQVNYNGFSAEMESEGALRIFSRSLPNYNVLYVQYLGDGDSKGCLRVQESNIYGDEFPVEKLECIGHVQKRMGARLRALKNNLKSTKLSDNKPISGRGRLTDAEILQLQKYYGLAISRNVGKAVADMSKSIWAIYFHKLSTDENPQHALCPMGEESWCGYNKSIVSGVNTCEGPRKIDYVRIYEAEMAVQKASKEARTTKRQIKRKQDALEQSMQDEYSAGNF